MKVVTEKPVLARICDEIMLTIRETGKPPLEILLSPAEVMELKQATWAMMPRRYLLSAGLPPGLKLWGVPVRVDEGVIG